MLKKIIVICIGAFALGIVALLGERCCSAVFKDVSSSHWGMTRYVVTDKWAFCNGTGDINIWYAENAFKAWQWIKAAEDKGHCVDY